MTEEKMAYDIMLKFSFTKNEEKTKYISTEQITKQSALIAVELLKNQTFINSSSYYSKEYWEKVSGIIKAQY